MIEKQARVTGDHGSSELKRKGTEKFISQKVFASCYLANSDGRPRLLTSLNERSFLSVKPDTEYHRDRVDGELSLILRFVLANDRPF